MQTRFLKYLLIALPFLAIVAASRLPEGSKTSFHENSGTSSSTVVDVQGNNCLSCHSGIESIRDPGSEMMQDIFDLAIKAGEAGNACVVCHGGTPSATAKEVAHSGTPTYFLNHSGPKDFYPDASSPYVNANTCGICHEEQVSTQFTSLMFTEAGKIQGTTWGFGGLHGFDHNVANTEVDELEIHQQLGSEVYKDYMKSLEEAEPQVFPTSMKSLPSAPTMDELREDPRRSAYTYLRKECQRCHTGVKGHEAKGDFRGIGCGSCHIPYSNKGLYEGGDASISKTEAGHALVHQIQSSRDVKVTVQGKSYSGVPTKTCTACHNRGRRIGVSYEGLMETSYSAPFMSNGSNQEQIHKKNYIHLQPDVHLTKGMLCQDCHTSGDIHSLGNLSGAIQGAVEIECQDCHGTPEKYPWELALGYSDEISNYSKENTEPRGVSSSVPDYLQYGYVGPALDGYLISARGNPMPNLVKDGKELVLYSASGKDIRFNPLKTSFERNEVSLEGQVAMKSVKGHTDNMECYTCHATWAPQCYGCHISIDYSIEDLGTDWVAVSEQHAPDGSTYPELSARAQHDLKDYLINGKIQEQRSYLRYEDPPLVMNGEHRISPAIPGCQTTVTIKDEKGNLLEKNHVYRLHHLEEGGKTGQLAIDMSPVQPHTVQSGSRSCESCHTNPKAMGYGIMNGTAFFQPDSNVVMDLADAFGNVIPTDVDTQFNAIENLEMDWSRFLDDEGNQLQTVGHHFSGSRALNKSELMRLDRRGVCLSCHQDVPDGSIAIDLMSHVAKYSGVEIDKHKHESILNKSIHLAAWMQILLGVLIGLLLGLVIYKLMRRFT